MLHTDADVLQQLLRCVPPAGGALASTVCAAQASAASLSGFKPHMRLGQVDSSYSELGTIRRGPCRNTAFRGGYEPLQHL